MFSNDLKGQDGSGLRFCSWNCRGLNNPVKRSKVLHHLQHLGAQVVFLQETHLKITHQTKLRSDWIGHTYISPSSGKSRGVAILVHTSVPFSCSNVIADPNGGYLIVSGKLHSTPVLLVNIYGPNWDEKSAFNSTRYIHTFSYFRG